jgi:hypothetical protein
MKNYYQILGIDPDRSIDEIKKVYRKLAKKYHPDINKSPDANSKFIEINEAYEMLLHQASVHENHVTAESPEYEELIQKIREEAQRRARMKYEKFQKEQKEFRESGLYDFVLILKYIGIIILPVFATFLIVLPFYIAVANNEPGAIGYLFFFWVIGGILWYDIIQRRKKYFKLGRLYYNWNKIKKYFYPVDSQTTEECFFCKGLPANAHPFHITILHIKSVRLLNQGPMQHYVGYNRTEEQMILPRSQKAFIIHSIVSLIKIVVLFYFILFVGLKSIVWRIIGGLIAGWIITTPILLVFRTRSKVGFLFSYALIIKIIVWLTVISVLSDFRFHPFNIYTSDYLPVTVFLMFFADSIMEQFLKMPKTNLYKPLMGYFNRYSNYFKKENYLYLEIPFWTTFFPLVRWII